MISLIVPTYNEKENIQLLIETVFGIFATNGIKGELIIVDDDSPDGTSRVAESFKEKYSVVVCNRRIKKGLSSAVIDGFLIAKNDIIGVMDADLSHDVMLIPDMVKCIQSENIDFVIGSRYVKGGGIDKKWPLKRKIISRIAEVSARILVKVNDPLSGFFFIKKNILSGIKLNDYGFKICLELLVKAKYNSVKEIPYIFCDRKKGKSKIDYSVVLGYIFQLIDLFIYRYFKKTNVS